MNDTAPASRRARLRDATVAEIKATARDLLVREGPEAITLRAIAREMGMTAPALYRYFANYEDLCAALCHDVLDDITAALEAARDRVSPADPLGRLAETCREFRRWALAHPREFQFTFASMGPATGEGGTPVPLGHEHEDGAISFGRVFLEIFAELWARQPFPVPSDAELPPGLVAQLRSFATEMGVELPAGVLAVFLNGWVRLYGVVTIEVFGHLGFALTDPEPMFEAMLADLRRQLTAPRR